MAGQIFNGFLGTSGSNAPALDSDPTEVSNTIKNNQNNSTMWGGIIGGFTNLIGGFNYKAQDNQIKLAQANADAARAQADAAKSQDNKKYWIIAGIVVAVVLLVVVLKRK